MDFYVAKNGQQTGPFSVEQLLAEGVTPETLVWCEGMAQWTPAKDVAEIAPLFAQVPPQPSYTQPTYQQPVYAPPVYGPQRPIEDKNVGFVDALKICFSKYFDFSGRARRSEFWYFSLWSVIITLFTCGIGFLAVFIPSIAVCVRRLHDTGRSGWWYGASLLLSIPLNIVNFLIQFNGDTSLGVVYIILYICNIAYSLALLYFYVSDSQPGDNQYGPNPKY